MAKYLLMAVSGSREFSQVYLKQLSAFRFFYFFILKPALTMRDRITVQKQETEAEIH